MSRNIHHLIKKTHQKLRDWHSKVVALKGNRNKEEVENVQHVHAPKNPPTEKMEITASSGTMARFVLIILILLGATAFLYEIRDVLIIFFVSLLFAAALDPFVDALERRKVPRSIALILIYILVLLVLAVFISNLVPIVAKEVAELAGRVQEFISNIVKGEIALPSYLERFRPSLKEFFAGIDVSALGNYKDVLLRIANELSGIAGNVLNAISFIFNGFFNTILVLVITFLMTVDETGIDNFILSLFPARYAPYIREKNSAIKQKIGYWLRGQIVLCFVVGICVYLGFLIVGFFTTPVEYAATIAIVAGFTELIPYAGPFVAWLIALPIVANQSLSLVVWMTILMYVVQLLENNVIVPMVMKKAVGISPIFIMFSMMVGFKFLGVLGMVLAVPVATAAAIFVSDYADRAK